MVSGIEERVGGGVMAWLRRFGECSCGKPATCEVMNNFNAPCGRYCEKCAGKAVKQMNEKDKKKK